MATKKWVPIVVGIVIFVVVVGIGLIGGLVYVIRSQVNVQTVSAAGGQEEFEKALAGMAGQKPFIELPARGSDAEPVVHRELETKQPGSISTLHVRVWVADERKLVRFDMPFWMLRLTGNKPMQINTGSYERMSLTVTPEEIERRGPGLLLDHTGRRGERVLVWTD
jgi:hypothetical protein